MEIALDTIMFNYYILSSNKVIFVWPIWPEVNCSYLHTPRKNRLLDYYKIISISRLILVQGNMGLDFVSGQYGCLFSRCWKYVINSLIYGHFHIGLVIIPRPIFVFFWGQKSFITLLLKKTFWLCIVNHLGFNSSWLPMAVSSVSHIGMPLLLFKRQNSAALLWIR